jgi:DNA replicative helicase MCM subunit Mcm2 (Cdc46/Mcm family)
MSDDAAEAIKAVEQFKEDQAMAERMQIEEEFEEATRSRDNEKSEKEAKKLAQRQTPAPK